MASKEKVPSRSRDLLVELDKQYPAKCVGKGETLEDAHRYAGKRELIDSLLEAQAADDERASRLNAQVTL